jgi:hypothetical protein
MKKIIYLVLVSLVLAGGMPVRAADSSENKHSQKNGKLEARKAGTHHGKRYKKHHAKRQIRKDAKRA